MRRVLICSMTLYYFIPLTLLPLPRSEDLTTRYSRRVYPELNEELTKDPRQAICG